MVEALRRVGGQAAVDLIDFSRSREVEDMIRTWPRQVVANRALKLGIPVNQNFDEVMDEYLRTQRR